MVDKGSKEPTAVMWTNTLPCMWEHRRRAVTSRASCNGQAPNSALFTNLAPTTESRQKTDISVARHSLTSSPLISGPGRPLLPRPLPWSCREEVHRSGRQKEKTWSPPTTSPVSYRGDSPRAEAPQPRGQASCQAASCSHSRGQREVTSAPGVHTCAKPHQC